MDKKYEKKIEQLLYACKKGTLDKDKLDLLSIKGIGEKKLDILLRVGITSLQEFIHYDNIILSKLIKMDINKIRKIKLDLINIT